MLIPLILSTMACSEYSYYSKIQKDVFQQVRRNTVDILLVIDDSCSMAEEQEKLSSNFQAFISTFSDSDVDVDWQIGVTTTDTYRTEIPGRLLGGDDELILKDPNGRSIDAVRWTREWPYEEGVAMQLSTDKYSTTSNTSIMNWCASEESYHDDNWGTPGSENHLCGSNRPIVIAEDEHYFSDTGENGDTGLDTGVTDGGVPPSVGDIIFTEVMLDSKNIPDSLGEWIELTNISDQNLDLSGYQIADDGRNLFVLPEGTIVPVASTLVVGRSADQSENGGVVVDVVSDNLTLNNKVFVLTSTQDDVQENFEEMVVVGTEGSGIEMGLEAARLALSEPLINEDNQGFLRDEANLSLIFVSDEDDASPLSAHSYLRAFTDIKGPSAYRDHAMLNVSAVVGMDKPRYDGDPSCVSDNGVGFYGPKYIELVNRTAGKVESICAEDFSPIAEELGLVASGLQLEFELSGLPDLDTLLVKIYAENTEESLIGELEKGVDYTYSIENNAIVFTPTTLPPSETYILAEYRLLPTGARILEDTAADTGSAE